MVSVLLFFFSLVGVGTEKGTDVVSNVKAYNVLSDDEKRRIYDTYGEEGLKQNENGGGASQDPFDFFFGGFGRQGGQGSQREKKGEDIEMDIVVSLEELFSGTSIEVGYQSIFSTI